MSAATVRIPTPLRSHTDGAQELRLRGRTVGDVLDSLGARHGELASLILDEKGEPSRVTLFVGSRDARRLEGRGTPIEDGSIITIVPRVAGS